MADERVNNTWDPQEFLDRQRNDLNVEFENIENYVPFTATIFRVPTQLDNNYVSACKPMCISIGPYHRWEHKLRSMEAYKLHYLKNLWKRTRLGRWNLTDFIVSLRNEMKELESRARACYSDPMINMKSDEFVEMMLLDGCFIVEFMFRLEMPPPTLSTTWEWIYVLRDLHILENQLPFFVLESIYGMVIDNSAIPPREALIGKLHDLLSKHLLSKLTPIENITRLIPQPDPDHLLHLFHLSLIGQDDHTNTQRKRNMFYRKATELELSGVKFKTKDDGRLLHVSFHNGILEMSPLTLNEDSNIYLRNFVALEQCKRKHGLHFSSYMFFIDNLVDSNKDVELLIKRGIFYNDMGSNEVVVKHFFDRLSNQIVTDNHLYDTLQEMEKYCEKPWPMWKATLSRDYFNNPWSIASFVAAVFLLALTMVQASGTIYRYIKN